MYGNIYGNEDENMAVCKHCGEWYYPEGMFGGHACKEGAAAYEAELAKKEKETPFGKSMYDYSASASFDPEKAFFLLKKMGLLHKCRR